MFCPNCGVTSNADSQFCPNCGYNMSSQQTTTYTDTTIDSCNDIPTTSLLVFIILELFCCNIVCGIIGLVLYFSKLKPTIQSGNREDALKTKKTIKTVLWIGFGLSAVIAILVFVFQALVVLPIISSSISDTSKALDSLNSTTSELSEDYNYDYDYDFDYDYDYDFDYDDYYNY